MKTKFFIINRAFALILSLITANIGCAQTTEELPENDPVISEKYGNDDLPELARYLETSCCPHEFSIGTAGGVSSLNSRRAFGITCNGFADSIGRGLYLFPD
jgi:hypothetical protein